VAPQKARFLASTAPHSGDWLLALLIANCGSEMRQSEWLSVCDLVSVCASLILASTAWKWMPKVAMRWNVRGLRVKAHDIMRLAMSFGEP